MKICPYCKEQIPDNSKICPECNEKLNMFNGANKQIAIWAVSIVIILIGLGFVGYEVVTANTLKEVQEVSNELQPVEYLKMIIKDEKILQRKLRNPQDKENNDKNFAIFYRNLLKYRKALLDNSDMPIDRYFEMQDIVLKNSSETKMDFVNPKTYAIYCETAESLQGLGINYNYLHVKYRNYLSDLQRIFVFIIPGRLR